MTAETIVPKMLDYIVAFGGALILTLVLTPLVRELNRRLGLIDKPDARRINKTPIPRGGGVAIFIGVIVSYYLFCHFSGRPFLTHEGSEGMLFPKYAAISLAIVALGWVDDKYGLPPKVKLLGQLIAAFLAWWWCGLGFQRLWPELPNFLDCILTVFWITGAINAFNLIDGLDGLASGIAFIATLGMAGTLFIIDTPQSMLFYFAFAGGLLGFLRYNYNPASVFLGDSGSMFIGFTLSILPLVSQVPNSFLVSVGIPMLAMGVPIFDTSLAIIRRSIRHLINKREPVTGSDNVMTADIDHLHHRILRASGLNQRKAAWILYAITLGAVAFGLVAASLESRTAGLWLIALGFASVIIFKNMSRIELYDAGRLLNSIAHNRAVKSRRLRARLNVPITLLCDISALMLAEIFLLWESGIGESLQFLRLALLIRTVTTLFFLTIFDVYRTVWSRAMLSNFLRLGVACFLGSLFGGAAIYFTPTLQVAEIGRFSMAYAVLAFAALSAIRLFRSVVRDLFYAMDCAHLKGRKDVSRILVYGAGLRYRTFRRELVRKTSENTRIIVGIIDDDILMRGQFIGGIRVEGTLAEASEIINRLNVDSVVVACEIEDDWLKVVKETLAPTGVKVTRFTFSEQPII